MSKMPPVPPEQRTFGKQVSATDGHEDRRDRATGAQSGQPGDADVNTREQGRFGNLSQNVKTTHWKTQDR